MDKIFNIIDRYFSFKDELGGNLDMLEDVPEKMKGPKHTELDCPTWVAIKSTVSDEEIAKLEKYYGHKLPNSYIEFLKYKHFVELNLGESSIGFFKNIPGTILQDTEKEIEEYYGSLLERNYLPFARMSDLGVLCFDAKSDINNHDYKVLSFDHEDEYESSDFYADNFETMFLEFETHLDDWIKRRREMNNVR